MSTPNPFLLAADNDLERLLPLLDANPSLANIQDEHGYSLLHAAASYNHVDLLRRLARDFSVDVNSVQDEDGETALFTSETVEVAKILVEELGADTRIRNNEGLTAAEKIEDDEEALVVAAWLRDYDRRRDENESNGVSVEQGSTQQNHQSRNPNSTSSTSFADDIVHSHPLPVPENLRIDLTTTTIIEDRSLPRSADPGSTTHGADQQNGRSSHEQSEAQVVDPEFKRRIEELAQRGDISDEQGQHELRRLVEKAVREHVTGSAGVASSGYGASRSDEDREQRRRRAT
ncbi:MAG: hypothetical protein M1815_004603 [Lichina confinis]|nr:MAG: hypothetical protein M1815_004603 [Lichina confinis]